MPRPWVTKPAAFGGQRVKRRRLVHPLNLETIRRCRRWRQFVQIARHARAVGMKVLSQIRRLRHRADDPIASDPAPQMRREDFANAPMRGLRCETGERDVVPRPGVSCKQPQSITLVMELNPRECSLEAQPFREIEFHRSSEV